jgi:hypothetical protein
MGDREGSATWLEIRSWAALGLAVVGVVGALWGRRTGAVFRPKDPVTHKIVCSCGCFEEGSHVGSVERFEERTDCSTLNGIYCETGGKSGTLRGCRKESVEVEARQRVSEKPPLVKG